MSNTLRKIAYHILTDKHSNIAEQIQNIESVKQTSTYGVLFEGENLDVVVKYSWSDKAYSYKGQYDTEVNGLDYMEEYQDEEEFSGDELRCFLAENPNLVAKVEEKRRDNVAKIAELNKQIAALINEMTELAEEANLDVTINLGQHGSLDPNSDWDSSRC